MKKKAKKLKNGHLSLLNLSYLSNIEYFNFHDKVHRKPTKFDEHKFYV